RSAPTHVDAAFVYGRSLIFPVTVSVGWLVTRKSAALPGLTKLSVVQESSSRRSIRRANRPTSFLIPFWVRWLDFFLMHTCTLAEMRTKASNGTAIRKFRRLLKKRELKTITPCRLTLINAS